MVTAYILIIAGGLLTALYLYAGGSNFSFPIVFNMLSTQISAPLGVVIIGAWAAGFALAAAWREAIPKIRPSEKVLDSWQAQDVKLVAEIQSDKEKQLESKIATLEVALKQALKKKA
ncbi:MAG: hypothetical protein P4L53_13480 [Candidatus Obscuribacterales bacterium]|nr:hypothetical protein [Candidatus Obscuribacterales bacterium]